MTKIELKVDGMHCKSCTILTKDALEEIGAKDVKVNLGSGTGPASVSCNYDGDKMDVINAIKKNGYKVLKNQRFLVSPKIKNFRRMLK